MRGRPPASPAPRYLREEAPAVGHAPVPTFLKVVFAVLAIWATVYFVRYLQPPPGYMNRFHSPPGDFAGSPAQRGKYLFQTVGCMNCHTVNGYGGTLGPNLTHIASSGLSPQFLEHWLSDPSKVMPGATMPRLPLTPGQIRDLTAYLEQLH